MVISLKIFDWDIKRVIVDPKSLTDDIYWEAFETLLQKTHVTSDVKLI